MRPEYSRRSYTESDSPPRGEFTWQKRLIIAVVMAAVFYGLTLVLVAVGVPMAFPLVAVVTIAAGYGTATVLNCP